MSTEIATLESTEIQLAFTSPNGIDILIDRIRKEAQSEVPDLSTAKGRARIASLAHKVSKTKVMVDDYGKELVAEEKKRLALIDADRKKWRDTCDAIRDEIRKPLTDWEAAEAARVQRHKDGIEELRSLANLAMGASSEVIRDLLAKAEAVPLGDHWQEFAAEAGKAKDETIAMLRVDLDSRLKHEAEQAELARLREEAARREQEEIARREAEAKAQAEREAKEREEQRIRESAERARIEAEAKAKAEREAAEREARRVQEEAERARIAAEQAEARAKAEAEAAKLREQEAERRRIEAEERAKSEAIEAAERAERERLAAVEAERKRAEQERIAAERKAAEEQAARDADKENRRKVNRDVLDAVKAIGISEEHGKSLIAALVAGKVPHVTLRY